MPVFPPTTRRVSFHTDPDVNERIENKTLRRVQRYQSADPADSYKRLYALDCEWDTERVLETSAAAFAIIGSMMGLFRGRRWNLFTGAVGLFMLQHALVGWCPPLPLIRRMGIRTAEEIEFERDLIESNLTD